MCCNSHGLTLSRSDPRFSYLSIIPSTRPDPRRNVFFPVRLQARTGRIRSKLNDVVSVAEPKSFYDLLGILETRYVSPPYRVKEYTQRFIQIQEAYETLSDPRRRALHDSDMAKGLHFAFFANGNPQIYGLPENAVGPWFNSDPSASVFPVTAVRLFCRRSKLNDTKRRTEEQTHTQKVKLHLYPQF